MAGHRPSKPSGKMERLRQPFWGPGEGRRAQRLSEARMDTGSQRLGDVEFGRLREGTPAVSDGWQTNKGADDRCCDWRELGVGLFGRY